LWTSQSHSSTPLDIPVVAVLSALAKGVCVIDRSKNGVILLVQEDKRFVVGSGYPYAQLIPITEAIAAFQSNNSRRQELRSAK
jgi:hypothetical protein